MHAGCPPPPKSIKEPAIFRPITKFIAALPLLAAATTFASTLEGTWRVIGDKSREAEALIAISEHDGVYEGKIVKIYPREGIDPAAICDLCPGKQKNQPVQGLTILRGLRQVGEEFTGGEILDPESGEVYRCSMKPSADRQKLQVRGYILIPLLGRSQTWVRESPDAR